jgi:hypothetical protein
MSMWVLASGNESWVRWEAANVDSNGAIVNWELIAFLTQPNADGELTLGPDTYRYYSASQVIFNWTRAKTGYTGGCGNVPNSCPEHALIRATVGYPNGVVVPAIVFREDGGVTCIVNNLSGGASSVASNCQISGADGIVVIFSDDDA